MTDEIRCQECGGAFSPIDKQTREVNTRCNKCGSIMAPRVQAQIRSRKRFDLVKALAAGDAVRMYEYDHTPMVIIDRAEAILTALYGPEPGGE